ncbi:MAG: hypothetical protein AVDCRST_MAG86-239 [uncultured Truepera sp.]|uniref:Uncharacterized protein n=1 Tax=uncultured Truepera sp. TaxID=543023 RepID=A0A6J4US27_9DEIN|nr:MAG: hypothetical protein AVDCRST_MAG86-239 [uncultured Truepera sp.]
MKIILEPSTQRVKQYPSRVGREPHVTAVGSPAFLAGGATIKALPVT